MDFQELLLIYYSMELKNQMHVLTLPSIVFFYEERKEGRKQADTFL